MSKRFNDTGLCIPGKHYMVDTSAKIEKMMQMIEYGDYFTINRPRQFGKTTTSYLLSQKLSTNDNFLVLEISFEGIGDAVFEYEDSFCRSFSEMLAQEFTFNEHPEIAEHIKGRISQVTKLDVLSQLITEFCRIAAKKVVLIIDEVDRSTNNQLFLSFLGILREKFLKRNRRRDYTFQSVILIGVHDVKSLKQKISTEATGKLNSPWNIAIDFTVELAFTPPEIETMLIEYAREKKVDMDIPTIARRIYYYTSGYPYLVSKTCKYIDENLLPGKDLKIWEVEDVENSFKRLTDSGYTTALFDSLFKYLESYPELYELAFNLIINGKSYNFALNDPIINLAATYGIVKNYDGLCQAHNRIFEQRMYIYFLSRQVTKHGYPIIDELSGFIENNQLNMPLILRKFQNFMQENYLFREADFLEQQGRLLFLSFLKPILNGRGFEFKEPVVGDERRIDLVITVQQQKYVVEMKIWRGKSYHQLGLQQFSDYLDQYKLKEGYLLIFDFRKNKTYKEEYIQVADKEIFAVRV